MGETTEALILFGIIGITGSVMYLVAYNTPSFGLAPPPTPIPQTRAEHVTPANVRNVQERIRIQSLALRAKFQELEKFFESPTFNCPTFGIMQSIQPAMYKAYMELQQECKVLSTNFFQWRDELGVLGQTQWLAAHSDWLDQPDFVQDKLDRYGMVLKWNQMYGKSTARPDAPDVRLPIRAIEWDEEEARRVRLQLKQVRGVKLEPEDVEMGETRGGTVARMMTAGEKANAERAMAAQRTRDRNTPAAPHPGVTDPSNERRHEVQRRCTRRTQTTGR